MKSSRAASGLATPRRTRATFGFAALIGLASCITSSFPKTPAEGGPAWQEITSEHFVVVTDLEPREANVIVGQLENLRSAMGETVFGSEPPPAAPARVLALRNDEYRHFDRTNAGMFIFSALFQPMLITSPGGDWGTFASDVRKHELAHCVANLYVDLRQMPRWFSEGLAEYLETTRYDEKTGAVEIGHHPYNYEYLDATKQPAPDELWAWSGATQREKVAGLYAASWAVVHYLFDQRPKEVLEYMQALAKGDEGRDAWNRIFPDLDGEGLAKTLRSYVHMQRYQIRRATVSPRAVAPKVRPLGQADVLAWRAVLYLALSSSSQRTDKESTALAKESVAASLALSPSNFWAHQVNFYYFGHAPDSIDLASQALANEKDNWLAWLWYASVLKKNRRPASERRAALTRSAELAPNNGQALSQLAVLEANLGNWGPSLDAASKAVQAPPFSTESILVYSLALSYSGRCNDARAVEAQFAKRTQGKLPEDATEIFEECHRACAKRFPESGAARDEPSP